MYAAPAKSDTRSRLYVSARSASPLRCGLWTCNVQYAYSSTQDASGPTVSTMLPNTRAGNLFSGRNHSCCEVSSCFVYRSAEADSITAIDPRGSLTETKCWAFHPPKLLRKDEIDDPPKSPLRRRTRNINSVGESRTFRQFSRMISIYGLSRLYFWG